MTAPMTNAFDDANALYDEYTKLSALGDLARLGDTRDNREIIASVSPVMCENYANAIVG
jgi:hypothetical protein